MNIQNHKLSNPLYFSKNYNFITTPKTSNKSKKGIFIVLLVVFLIFCIAFYNFYSFVFYFIIISNIIFVLNFVFKLSLFLIYLKIKPKQALKTQNKNLPIYTILLPCYKETKETLTNLIHSIYNLNYPREKLDIKFLLEKDDSLTITNISGLKHDFEILTIPHGFPKTKPKACNYGLYYARGEFVVIYDAEDKPEPNQLLKVLSHFESSDENLICVQCKLNFYNTHNNIISSCFSLEYLTWFNVFLPSVLKLGFFIPLGGTSNHFKTDKLFKIGAWDPYNVTEDAELGIRIKKYSYKCDIIDSYTLEEAPFKIEDWIFQRQRWMKGYLQTFVIHMLDFRNNIKLGILNTFGIILLLGFSFLSFFLLPLNMLFAFFIEIKNTIILTLLFLNSGCIILYIMMFFYVSKKEKFTNYKGSEALMPLYFLLHSIASILGFYQFFSKPFYWNKTQHSVKNDL